MSDLLANPSNLLVNYRMFFFHLFKASSFEASISFLRLRADEELSCCAPPVVVWHKGTICARYQWQHSTSGKMHMGQPFGKVILICVKKGVLGRATAWTKRDFYCILQMVCFKKVWTSVTWSRSLASWKLRKGRVNNSKVFSGLVWKSPDECQCVWNGAWQFFYLFFLIKVSICAHFCVQHMDSKQGMGRWVRILRCLYRQKGLIELAGFLCM